MVTIKELVNLGYRCPRCNSKEVRAGYHEYQVLDSFICEMCGLRWNEDSQGRDIDSWKDIINDDERLVWILHLNSKTDEPISNPHSSDEQDWEEWIAESYSEQLTNMNPSKRKKIAKGEALYNL